MRQVYVRFVAMLMLAFVPVTLAVVAASPASAQDSGEGPLAGSLPIYGVLQDDSGEVGTFQGSVSELVASDDDDELTLDGMLSGLAVIDGDTVRITDQEFSSVVEPSVVGSIDAEDYSADEGDADEGEGDDEDADEDEDDATPVGGRLTGAQAFGLQTATDESKCDVLFLNIQPITLNLLGLEVLTSPITIDVNAIPGEGNLLGNLVCSLAGLLDGTPDAIAEITDQLNQILSGAGVAPPGPPQATPVT